MKYLFVFRNGGWWLRIKTLEELADYHEKSSKIWEDAFSSLIHSKEFGSGMHHASYLASAIGFFASRKKLSPIQGTAQFMDTVNETQVKLIMSGKDLYFNSRGGYCFISKNEKDYSQFLWKDELVFPDFNENEIKVKQFPGGTHFYAYIGNMEVRDGDKIKWDTYQDAYSYAKSIVAK